MTERSPASGPAELPPPTGEPVPLPPPPGYGGGLPRYPNPAADWRYPAPTPGDQLGYGGQVPHVHGSARPSSRMPGAVFTAVVAGLWVLGFSAGPSLARFVAAAVAVGCGWSAVRDASAANRLWDAGDQPRARAAHGRVLGWVLTGLLVPEVLWVVVGVMHALSSLTHGG